MIHLLPRSFIPCKSKPCGPSQSISLDAPEDIDEIYNVIITANDYKSSIKVETVYHFNMLA